MADDIVQRLIDTANPPERGALNRFIVDACLLLKEAAHEIQLLRHELEQCDRPDDRTEPDPVGIAKQLRYWLTDLQLADDPKQYLVARAYARIMELEALLWQWEKVGTEVRTHLEGSRGI